MTLVPDRLTEALEHRRTGGLENDAILDALIGGMADGMERLGLVAFGEEGQPAERVLTDPRFAPLWALAHSAMYTGAILPGRLAGESEADYLARARDAVAFPLGIRRGTHEAIRRAVQPLLTGGKNVFIDDPAGSYDITVRVLTSETPDAAAVEAALEGDFVSGGQRGAIRAELRLNLIVSDEAVINELDGTINSYTADTINDIGGP